MVEGGVWGFPWRDRRVLEALGPEFAAAFGVGYAKGLRFMLRFRVQGFGFRV